MMSFWRRARPQEKTPCPPRPEDGQTVDDVIARVQVSARSCPPLIPMDSSVSSFVSWMRTTIERSHYHAEQGWTRHPLPKEWGFEDLYEQYTEVSKLGRRRPEVGSDGFWDALKAAGCTRRRGDLRVNGSRSRPYLYAIPSEPLPPALKVIRTAANGGDHAAYASRERPKLRHHWSQGTLGKSASHRTKGQGNGAAKHGNQMEAAA